MKTSNINKILELIKTHQNFLNINSNQDLYNKIILNFNILKINLYKNLYSYFKENRSLKFEGTHICLDEYNQEAITIIQNNKIHNEEGPAILHKNGTVHYLQNNKFSNLNGPANIYSDGGLYYYIDGYGIHKENYEVEVRKYNLKSFA